MSKLVLASSSVYRKALLERLQLPFDCYSPNIDESLLQGESGYQLAQRLSLQKAQAVGAKFPDSIIIGSDQVAELVAPNKQNTNGSQQNRILGKPGNHSQAVNQLTAQSGQRVLFHTGLAVIYQGVEKSIVNTTEVAFRELTLDQIENYLCREKPYDCAGSFKAESLGVSLFRAVNSNDPTSLIGLPLIELCNLLAEFDIEV
jgi:septum formation protein